jgi:hypothetical protein
MAMKVMLSEYSQYLLVCNAIQFDAQRHMCIMVFPPFTVQVMLTYTFWRAGCCAGWSPRHADSLRTYLSRSAQQRRCQLFQSTTSSSLHARMSDTAAKSRARHQQHLNRHAQCRWNHGIVFWHQSSFWSTA